MSETETNFDPFEDETAATDKTPEAEITTETNEADDAEIENEEVDTGDEGSDAGDEASEEGNEEEEVTGKMIPEKRFKAAIKQVTEERDEANRKLAELNKPQAPDKEKDPEGYEYFNRMEASKAVMIEMKPDYDEVIAHYVELSKSNPLLNQAVYKHPIPAKLAYDIAKRDLEIKELDALKKDPELAEFKEWKKNKGKEVVQSSESSKVAASLTSGTGKVPNLNRATNAVPNKATQSEDNDYLFKDCKF